MMTTDRFGIHSLALANNHFRTNPRYGFMYPFHKYEIRKPRPLLLEYPATLELFD